MSQTKYDFLIVGAGVYGSVFAREMTDRGKRCLVIDQLRHVAGHCYTEEREGIHLHVYGPHIFHTDREDIWKYVQKFARFTPYCHRIKSFYRDKIYSFPINLSTLNQLWGVNTPDQARMLLETKKIPFANPANMEEWALSQVGEEIYKTFFHGYTTKQWGKDPKELSPSILKRLPIRLSFDDTYYNDRFQGIPEEGYTHLFKRLLDGIEVRLNENYFDKKIEWDRLAKTIVFTGRIDEFFDYKYGELGYRSLRFENQIVDIPDYQGTSVMNYPDARVPFTRITEYKHFQWHKFLTTPLPYTLISKEFPDTWNRDKTPYYPVNTAENDQIFEKYRKEAEQLKNLIFGGRLAEFKYYDMHQVIGSALAKVEQLSQTVFPELKK
ncbi:MAG: UDP-galactopyranose mutase [Parachlamydiaceae bacterium]|nr:UDP-galactopyranose mutase [Parachlamydiaceae bacterium]